MTIRALPIVLALSTVIPAAERPNVLWITCEDTGPQLGCYGDAYSVTPHLDEFAKSACRYRHCWSNAPVCAPARTTIITGMYPTSLGAEHMRSLVKLPPHVRLYPQYLRDAGYYCSNNSKTDYNVAAIGKVWDDSSNKAHWKNRPAGTPFFAIFNHTITHESRIRDAIDEQDRVHDPAQARVPAYHPDTPEVRKDWAQYYDRITMMDKLAGDNLRELRDAGLADDTIVFFYGDHGSGMPRSKRSACNSGLHVPLLIHIPKKWRHLATSDCVMGGASDRLVSFVDLAPTLLSLCGVEIPAHMQGHAFLGDKPTEPQPFVYGFRGRMDERIDMVRSVTDGRYVYVRNFMPHLPHGQHCDYMFQTPTTRVWYELWKAGKCNAAQSHFWEPKPVEELYDLQTDPDEVHNLAAAPDQADRVRSLSHALQRHLRTTRDLGFIPEAELHRLTQDDSPWNLGQKLETQMLELPAGRQASVCEYSIQIAMHLPAILAAQGTSAAAVTAGWVDRPQDGSSIVRYWHVLSALSTHGKDLDQYRHVLRSLLTDNSPAVRIAAAEALGSYGNDEDLSLALPVLLEFANAEKHGVYNAVQALNAIDHLGEKANSIRAQVAQLPRKDPNAPDRLGDYCGRLIEHITSESRP